MSQSGVESTVRLATEEDYPAIASIHREQLHTSLLARLGSSFLINFLYPHLLKESGIELFVCVHDDTIVGLALFEERVGLISRVIAKNKLQVLWALICNLLTDPFLFYDCLSARSENSNSTDLDASHLAVIAISKGTQGLGIGTQLLKHCLEALALKWNFEKMVVETRTDQAVNFYKKNEFHVVRQIKRGHKTFVCLELMNS